MHFCSSISRILTPAKKALGKRVNKNKRDFTGCFINRMNLPVAIRSAPDKLISLFIL